MLPWRPSNFLPYILVEKKFSMRYSVTKKIQGWFLLDCRLLYFLFKRLRDICLYASLPCFVYSSTLMHPTFFFPHFLMTPNAFFSLDIHHSFLQSCTMHIINPAFNLLTAAKRMNRIYYIVYTWFGMKFEGLPNEFINHVTVIESCLQINGNKHWYTLITSWH